MTVSPHVRRASAVRAVIVMIAVAQVVLALVASVLVVVPAVAPVALSLAKVARLQKPHPHLLPQPNKELLSDHPQRRPLNYGPVAQ